MILEEETYLCGVTHISVTTLRSSSTPPLFAAKAARELGLPLNTLQNQWIPSTPLAPVTTSNQTFGVRFRTTETFTSRCNPGSTSTGGQQGLSLKSPVLRKRVPSHHAKSSP